MTYPAASFFPEIYFGGAFNRDPNDPLATPYWTDLSEIMTEVGENSRGRQYELGVSPAAQPSVTFFDPDELLNPANADSALYPYVSPFRELLMLATWPNDPSFTDVNLINSGAWRGNKVDAYDPGFESYANGAAIPNWLTAVGSVNATITTTNPQQGTKSATYTVAATAVRQGLSWSVPCVPGRQYTSSAYVRQSSASTQRIEIPDQLVVSDTFAPRVVVGGFGSPDFGPAYSPSVPAECAVTGGYGIVSPATGGADRTIAVALGSADQNQVVRIGPIPTPGALNVRQGVTGRFTNVSNNYLAYVQIDTAGVVSAIIGERNAGVFAVLATTVTTLSAAVPLMLRFECTGADTLRMKAWTATAAEPDAWTTTATDATQTGTSGGMLARYESSTTVFYFDTYQAVATVLGSTTTTTGAYVRLSATWTATQPQHTVRLATVGTAVAGTVNQDSLQHEAGASATTWQDEGPVIYPVMRPYAERWTRTWESAGFEGWAETPAVDASAALAAIRLSPEYEVALAATAPDWAWSLGDGTDATAFTSAIAGRAPLRPVISKLGVGSGFAPGTPIAIPGGAGATGVFFTDAPAAGPSSAAGVCLGVGRSATGANTFSWPVYAASWGASIAAWVTLAELGLTSIPGVILPFLPPAVGGGQYTDPLSLAWGTGGIELHTRGRPAAGGLGIAAGVSSSPDPGPDAHLLVGTITQASGGNTTIKLYIDGALFDTLTVTTASVGGLYAVPAQTLNVGGHISPDGFSGGFHPGAVAWPSLWNRELTADEITALWEAGGLGHAGETPNARSLRHLEAGGYTGASRITVESATTMQPPTWTGSIDLLTDTQNSTQIESGTEWIGPDGAVVIESRQDRYLRLDPLYVLGEDEAGGELPYLEGITYELDTTFTYADVTVGRVDGAIATGGLTADIVEARRRWFPRAFQLSGDMQTDQMAQDLADWVFYTHRAPLLRVAEITFDPVGNPALWPFVLSVEVGQRVRVVRRPKAGNAGAGLTMSADYFVETVKHDRIVPKSGIWTVSLLLSPIGEGPGVTVQPWILDDTTLSVLGASTIPGY